MKFRINSSGCRSLWRIIMRVLLATSLSVAVFTTAHGQPNPPSSVRCPSPADPNRSHFECVGRRFDFIEETLTQDWRGLRTELRELGIKPTASYTTNLMGNPSGGLSRGFTYAGTLQASIFWDLDKLLRLPGFRSTSAEHGPQARISPSNISATTFGCRALIRLRAMAPIT